MGSNAKSQCKDVAFETILKASLTCYFNSFRGFTKSMFDQLLYIKSS